MDYILDQLERRVLGSLLEKAATGSSAYPMTVNSLVSACNQKSNRDPLMDLDEDAVWSTLQQLIARGLVTRILPGPGSRADKFKHEVDRQFNWQSRQRAVMTELMLRGPQTPGELRTRASRMASFGSVGEVNEVLESLKNWDPPLVAALPRAAGQSAIRFMHLLVPEDEEAQQYSEPEAEGQATGSVPSPARAAVAPASDALRTELEQTQEEIAELHQTIAELERRVAALEERLR